MKLKHIKSELILLRLAFVIDEFICTRCTYLKGGIERSHHGSHLVLYTDHGKYTLLVKRNVKYLKPNVIPKVCFTLAS